MINRPLKYKEPHTYKDICKKKYSTVVKLTESLTIRKTPSLEIK